MKSIIILFLLSPVISYSNSVEQSEIKEHPGDFQALEEATETHETSFGDSEITKQLEDYRTWEKGYRAWVDALAERKSNIPSSVEERFRSEASRLEKANRSLGESFRQTTQACLNLFEE